MATCGFPRTHVRWSCGRSTEKKWSPTGPGCPSPVSLDLACRFGLRLPAAEAVLGLESTRPRVLPVSICFLQKPTGLGCQASLQAAPPSSALCLCCSICCSTSSWLNSLDLVISLPEPSSCSLFLPILSAGLCPTTFTPQSLRSSFCLCLYPSFFSLLLCRFPPCSHSLSLSLIHIQWLHENPPRLFHMLQA